jgi:uncharacterized coiled-coil protein SlyX
MLSKSLAEQNNTIAHLERQLAIKSETITSLEYQKNQDKLLIDQLQRLNDRLVKNI